MRLDSFWKVGVIHLYLFLFVGRQLLVQTFGVLQLLSGPFQGFVAILHVPVGFVGGCLEFGNFLFHDDDNQEEEEEDGYDTNRLRVDDSPHGTQGFQNGQQDSQGDQSRESDLTRSACERKHSTARAQCWTWQWLADVWIALTVS